MGAVVNQLNELNLLETAGDHCVQAEFKFNKPDIFILYLHFYDESEQGTFNSLFHCCMIGTVTLKVLVNIFSH